MTTTKTDTAPDDSPAEENIRTMTLGDVASAPSPSKKKEKHGGKQQAKAAPAQEPAPAPEPEPEPSFICEIPPDDVPAETAPVAPAPVTGPVATDDESLRKGIMDVLRQRDIRNTAPTLVDFRMTGSNRRLYALVELDADTVRAAWRVWVEAKGIYDQEAFMLTVHELIKTKLPRVYRQVNPLRLDESMTRKGP